MFHFLENYRLDGFTDWVAAIVIHGAPFAPLFLLLLEESGIPLPVPGDVYLAFIGYQVSIGKIPYLAAFLLLLLSVLCGSSILYYISRRWGNFLVLKIGKYIHLNEKKLQKVEENFKKYGIWVIIFGRHIPGFRVPITFFAGISGVPYLTFITSTFISVVFWIAFYLSLGQRLGKHVLILFHTNHWYALLFFVPFLFFLAPILFVHVKNKREKKQPKSTT